MNLKLFAMKQKLLALTLFFLLGQLPVQAQRANFLNYRTPYTPLSGCFVPQGELKVSLLRQLQWPDMYWTRGEDFGYRAEVLMVHLFGNWMLVADSRINLSYGLTDNILLHSGYLNTHRRELFAVVGSGDNISYDVDIHTFDLGGSYHAEMLPNLQWEAGSSVIFGWGHSVFEEISPSGVFPSTFIYSHIRYQTFTHNFMLGLSYRYKKIQLSAQLNGGYLWHHHISYDPVYPYAYEHIGKHFYDHQLDWYLDPHFMVNFNFNRFGLQVHTGYPYSFGERKLTKHMPTFGLGLQFKILKGG